MEKVVGQRMPQAKYHHRIPKTYLSSWCFSGNTIWTYDKLCNFKKERNIEKICGMNYFHSIKAGSIYATEEDLMKIYSPLADYNVEYNGKMLEGPEEFNQYFLDFDEWDIYYKDMSRISKSKRNELKSLLSQTVVNEIEEQWNVTLENDWNNFKNTITATVLDIKNGMHVFLTKKEKDKLLKYFTMYEWRGLIGNEQLNRVFKWLFEELNVLDDFAIPEEDRVYKYDETVKSEIHHSFLLKAYREFLNDDGVMYKYYEIYKENLTMLFILAPDDFNFITSDNPCFTFENEKGYKEPILPISPKILLSLAKKDPQEPDAYKILDINREEAKCYNKVIYEQGNLILSIDENHLDELIS